MRHLHKSFGLAAFTACVLTVSGFAQAQPGAAQEEGPPVPVEKAAWHWPVFRNDYVMLLRVYFPPGKGSNYHTHSLDQISVLVEAGNNAGQLYGEQPTPPRPGQRGNVGYTAYSKKPMSHRSTNVGTTPFNNVVIALLQPQSGRFTPAARDVPGYTQVLDNERVRGWRLILEPGQIAPAITQTSPGLRVVVDGGEIAELVPGEPDRGMALKLGEFYWQEPGATRAVRNIGTTPVHIVEFELK